MADTAPPVRPAEVLAVSFVRELRAAGLDVPLGTVPVYVAALAAVGLDSAAGVYWAGRAALVRRPEDAAVYDRVYGSFWLGEGGDRPPRVAATVAGAVPGAGPPSGAHRRPADAPPAPPRAPVATARYSPAERLRRKSFEAYTPAELDEARRLMADLRLVGDLRRSRRLVRGLRPQGRPDLRATARRALRTGGVPVRRLFRQRAPRPRPVVVLCDVSGSMEGYARALARFLHVAVVGRGRRRVEAFAVGTRLTRITRELSSRDPDAALAAAARAVVDWGGGTRLGEGLRAFNDEWGVRGMARGAVVVVVSDGWDRGDPALLGEQMARLHRVAHRVVWVNPLKAGPGYEPLAGGMRAALPHVDAFLAGHSLASLEELVAAVAGATPRRAHASR